MKKLLKKIAPVMFTAFLILSVLAITASASYMGFGDDTTQKHINEFTQHSWNNPISNNNVGTASYSSNIFGSFQYVKNESSCNGVRFILRYDRVMGVYTPDNDYDEYDVYWAASFDEQLKRRVKLGQIEVKIEARTRNAKGTFNQETGRISLKGYQSNQTTETFDFYSTSAKCDGERYIESAWIKIPSDTEYLRINAWSDRGGLGTQKRNRSAVYDICVYLRDTTPPKPVEAGIVQGNDRYWNNLDVCTNTSGNQFRVATPGDTILYYVKFNEELGRISSNDTKQLKLRIQNRGDVRFPTREFYAYYHSHSGDTIYFYFDVTDNTDCVTASKDTSLNPTGATYELIHIGICDKSSNYIDYKKPLHLLSMFKTAPLRIDDVDTSFAKELNDENGYYPAKYTRIPSGGYVYGSFPDDLKGTTLKTGSGNPNLQPTVTGPDTPLYFRIVVDDEIQKSMLNENTKLKVVISKNKTTPFLGMDERKGDKFGYATLVCARIIGNNNGASNHYGIKNNMVTEMFFKYEHDKNDYTLKNTAYTVYPAFSVGGSIPAESVWVSVSTLENNGYFLSNNNKPLKTTSGDSVLYIYNSRLKTGPVPLIDSRPPELVEENLTDDWTVKLPAGSLLKFSDDSGISNEGVTISVVQYDLYGNKITLPIKMPGSGAGYSYVIPVMYSNADISGLQIAEPLSGDQYQMYFEYSVKDKAGNETNNYGKKNIRIYLDSTPPKTTYRNNYVDENYASVTYNVYDYGIGEISPVVYYKVEAMGMFGNTPSISEKTAYKYDNPRVLDFTGVQGTREMWRLWASHADTLGNRAVNADGEIIYTPSEPIELATRKLNMYAFRKSEMVSVEHDVRINIIDEPATDYSIELYYKWVPGSTDKAYIKYKSMTITDYDTQLGNINFADEEIIKQFVGNEYEVSGEYTLLAYARLLPEDTYCYNITQTVYFDKRSPSVTTSVKMSDPDKEISEIHYISYDITDDGGNYKNGIYTERRNIKFVPSYIDQNAAVYPKFNTYIDDKLVKSDNLTLLTGTYVSNVKQDYLGNLDFKGSRSIRYEIVTEDNFGHETVENIGSFYLDAVYPELTEIEVKFKEGSNSKYNEEHDYYVVNSLADIESFSTTLTDNVEGNLTISHESNGGFKHFTNPVSSTKYEYTYNNPVRADFSITNYKQRWLYEFAFEGEDVIGNPANTQAVYFLVDAKAPEIKGRIPHYSAGYHKGTELFFDLEYEYENYEQFEDFTIEVEGDGITIDHYYLGRFKVTVTQNTEAKITITDGIGNSTSKSFEIDWYDETSPEISEGKTHQIPETGAAKYGEVRFSATDSNYVGTVNVAIVPEGETPEESDYFDAGVTGEYFGDGTLEYTEVYLTKSSENQYILEYKAIPDGTYDIYAVAYDSCGNKSEETQIAQITTTTEGAKLVSGPTYTPDTLTGGEVVVNIKTDIPTARIYDIEADGSVAAMQESVLEARERGFSYVRDGGYRHETEFDAINALYEELRDKDEYDLTPEEKEIYKGYNTGSSYDPYAGILDPGNTYDYIVPQRDVLDFLHNEAFYPIEETYEGYDIIKTVYEDTRQVEIVDSFMLDAEALSKAGIANDSEIGIEFDEVGIFTMNVLTYPTRFDESNYGEYNKALYEKYLTCTNPFYGEAFTEELIYETFGEGIDLSLFTHEEGSEDYFFPIDSEEITATEIINAGFGEYLELFSTGEYTNPFVTDGENLTEEDIIAALAEISSLKELRKKTATIVADRYCKFYLNNVNQSYSENHNLRFRYNTERNVRFMDKTGQEISVPIKINWIDPSLPHVPYDNMLLELVTTHDYEDSEPYDSLYEVTGSVSLTPEPEYGIVDKKLRLTVDLTSFKENDDVDIYDQYYLINLPAGAVGDEAEGAYDGGIVYNKFILDITENGIVSFDVINPSVMDDATKTYIAPQIYVIDCIDSEPPTASLEYSPEKPSDSNKRVNTDVTVTVTDMLDNTSAGHEIDFDYDEMLAINEIDELSDELYYHSRYTFTENGEFTFVISDSVGNRTYLPAKVDYIDKNGVEIDLELSYDGGKVEIKDVSEENTDTKLVEKVYEVIDERSFSKELEIKAYVNGELIAEDVILVGENEWSIEYEGPSGNIGTAYISGFKFDTEPPEASVSYSVHRPGKGEKSYAVATISVFDELVKNLSVVSVKGIAGTHEYTLSDAVISLPESDEDPATVELVFNENGYADVVIADAVGNTTTVQLSVSNLDRTAPTANVQYSSKNVTNNDVDAMILLSEPADYQIFDTNGDIIRDYSGVFTNYFSYTFTENKTLFLRFTDSDGNESDSFIATVTNIDKDAPELRVKEIHKNKAMDMEDKMVTYYGAATIELEVVSAGDILKGTEEDNIILVGASQSLYHTVMENNTYTFMYSDLAGNINKLVVNVDVIDNTPPTATVTGNPTEWTNVPTEITITANDKPDGSPSFIVMNGVEYRTVKLTAIENGDVGYVLRDRSNNSVTGAVEVRFVDTVAPSIEFEGNKDIYILPGEFDKVEFENVECYDNEDGSGINSDGMVIAYPDGFDGNTPGDYDVSFTVTDIAGNTSSLVRKITVLSDDDVFAVINGTVLIPNTMTTFWNGEELELSFLNAEKQGNKLSYAFEPGYFMAAEMKGTPYKYLTTPDAKITLDSEEAGMYTLFVQTEDRKMMVMYIFLAGVENVE